MKKSVRILATVCSSIILAVSIIMFTTGLCLGETAAWIVFLILGVIFIGTIVLLWIPRNHHIKKQLTSFSDQISPQKQRFTNTTSQNNIVENFASQLASSSMVSFEIQDDGPPKEILRDMKKYYTPMQLSDDFRILNDCNTLITQTKKFDTFFSRYELGMQKAYTIQQAKQAGIKGTKQIFQAAEEFIHHASQQKLRILETSLTEQQQETNKLSTPKGKSNRWKKYLERLEQYEDNFGFENENRLEEIKSYVLEQIQEYQK